MVFVRTPFARSNVETSRVNPWAKPAAIKETQKLSANNLNDLNLLPLPREWNPARYYLHDPTEQIHHYECS